MKGARRAEITGRYVDVEVKGESYKIYYEEAGKGIPLCCLHTAATDSREFHDMMEDPEVTEKFRVIAFDAPLHGKSEPAAGWFGSQYSLTGEFYAQTIVNFCRALGLARPLVMGCSMGGSVIFELAADYPREFSAVIGLEGTDVSSGKMLPFFDHPHINPAEFLPQYVSGLVSPRAPRRNMERILWYYCQSGKGVMAGDMMYYYKMDLRRKAASIDTGECPVYLLTGEDDYSCTPEMTKQTARRVKGAKFTEMKDLGHFPMTEDYPRFRRYLLPVLRKAEKDWAARSRGRRRPRS